MTDVFIVEAAHSARVLDPEMERGRIGASVEKALNALRGEDEQAYMSLAIKALDQAGVDRITQEKIMRILGSNR